MIIAFLRFHVPASAKDCLSGAFFNQRAMPISKISWSELLSNNF
jgi:hypothetical protein